LEKEQQQQNIIGTPSLDMRGKVACENDENKAEIDASDKDVFGVLK
jgi:hypothetical protein